MAMDDDALTRQVHALERDLANCKRELDAPRRNHGYLDNRVTRVESGCWGAMEQRTGLRAGRGSVLTSKLLIF